MNQPANSHENHMTSAILLNDFERSLRAARRSENTVTHYLGATRQFFDWLGPDADVEDITRADIENWLVALQERYRPASVLNRYKGLRAFWRWLEDEDEIDANPMRRVKPPSVPETSKDIVPPDDLRRMFALLEKGKRWRDAAMIAILYDTGMRAGELASVKVADLDRETGIITLHADNTKASRGRVVRVSAPTGVYIDRYLRRRKLRRQSDGQWLMVGHRGPMTASGLWQVVSACFEEIGITGIGPHDIRHSSATHSAGEMSEGALQTLFGWQSNKMVRWYSRQRLSEVALNEHRTSSPMERLGK